MIRRLLLAALAALCLLPAAASAQVITSTPPSCAKAGANTVTASAPVLDCTQTWNNAGITFYGFRLNVTDTASASGSLLMDLQKAGVSQFSVSKSGAVTAAGNILTDPVVGANIGWVARTLLNAPSDGVLQIKSNGGTSSVNLTVGASNLLTLNGGLTTGDIVTSAGGFAAGSGNAYQFNGDTFLRRDAANTLALRNGVSAQAFNVYNTYTDASNYERGLVGWSGGSFKLATQSAGTGSARGFQFSIGASDIIFIGTDGMLKWNSDNTYDIGASGANRPRNLYLGGNATTGGTIIAGAAIRRKGYTVATLPSATIGDMAYVTDAVACTFLAGITGGAATFCPVIYNGTAWIAE